MLRFGVVRDCKSKRRSSPDYLHAVRSPKASRGCEIRSHARPFEHSVIVRPTAFRPAIEANEDQRIQFQDLYRELIHDLDRNRLICERRRSIDS